HRSVREVQHSRRLVDQNDADAEQREDRAEEHAVGGVLREQRGTEGQQGYHPHPQSPLFETRAIGLPAVSQFVTRQNRLRQICSIIVCPIPRWSADDVLIGAPIPVSKLWRFPRM